MCGVTSFGCFSFGEDAIGHDKGVIFIFGNKEIGNWFNFVVQKSSFFGFVIEKFPFF